MINRLEYPHNVVKTGKDFMFISDPGQVIQRNVLQFGNGSEPKRYLMLHCSSLAAGTVYKFS